MTFDQVLALMDGLGKITIPLLIALFGYMQWAKGDRPDKLGSAAEHIAGAAGDVVKMSQDEWQRKEVELTRYRTAVNYFIARCGAEHPKEVAHIYRVLNGETEA